MGRRIAGAQGCPRALYLQNVKLSPSGSPKCETVAKRCPADLLSVKLSSMFAPRYSRMLNSRRLLASRFPGCENCRHFATGFSRMRSWRRLLTSRTPKMMNCRRLWASGSPECETVVKLCHRVLQGVKLSSTFDLRSSDMCRPTHGLAGSTRRTRTRWVSQTLALCGWRQRVRGGFLSTIASESRPVVAAVLRVAPASRDHFLRENENYGPLAVRFCGWRRTRWRTRWRVRACSPNTKTDSLATPEQRPPLKF